MRPSLISVTGYSFQNYRTRFEKITGFRAWKEYHLFNFHLWSGFVRNAIKCVDLSLSYVTLKQLGQPATSFAMQEDPSYSEVRVVNGMHCPVKYS